MGQYGSLLRMAQTVFPQITEERTQIVQATPGAVEVRYTQIAPKLIPLSSVRARAIGILGLLFMRSDLIARAYRLSLDREDIALPFEPFVVTLWGICYTGRWCYDQQRDTLFISEFAERPTWAPYHDTLTIH